MELEDVNKFKLFLVACALILWNVLFFGIVPDLSRGWYVSYKLGLAQNFMRKNQKYYHEAPGMAKVSGIPKIIHQSWKTDGNFPEMNSVEEWKNSLFVKKHGYEYKLWTDASTLELIKKHYPFLLESFLGYENNIQRADVGRYAILHSEGGIYADIDCFPNEAIAPKQTNYFVGSIQDNYDMVFIRKGDVVPQYFMATSRYNSFIEIILAMLPEHSHTFQLLPYLRIFISTGPWYYTKIFVQWFSYNKAYATKSIRWLEFDSYKTVVERNNVDFWFNRMSSFVTHQHGRSWMSLDGIFFNGIGDIVGDQPLVVVPVIILITSVVLSILYLILVKEITFICRFSKLVLFKRRVVSKLTNLFFIALIFILYSAFYIYHDLRKFD